MPRAPRLPRPPGGRDAGLLLLARVLMSGERALVSVVVPIYLARHGYSATKLAVLFAIVALAAAVLSLLIGVASDRIGRRVAVIALPLATAAAAAVFAVTDHMVLLFVFAAIGSFGRGSGAGSASVGPYQPAEQALMSGMVTDPNRPRLFGWVASASAAGGLLGAVLAASPVGAPTGSGPVSAGTYRLAFVVAAVLAAAAGLIAVPVREERRRLATDPEADEPDAESDAVADVVAQGRVRLSALGRAIVYRLWVTNVTNGIAVGLFGPFITYWLYRRFDTGTTTVGLIYIVVNVVTIGTNLLTHRVARRFGDVPAVVVLRSAQAVLLVPLALSPNLAVAAGIYTLRMAVQRIGVAVRQSFVMTAAPAHERARVAALSRLPSQGIAGIAPLFTGYLFDEVSLSAPFEIGAFFQLCNALSFGYLFRRDSPARRPTRELERERPG
jgi:MFS family permease